MVFGTDFVIINYTKNSESSLKIESMSQSICQEKIRSNRVRIQQNLKIKLNQHQKKIPIQENPQSSIILPPKTEKHIKILNQVGMVQKQYIQGQFQDQYTLKEKIGQGAHASVYRCIQKGTGKAFAVKITKLNDEELIECSKVQFKILKSLNHENIMKAEAFYTDKVKLTTYLVCQLCSSQELAIHLRNRKNKFLDEAQATTIISSLIQTLQYLHKKGVCHRDIKPQNILYDPQTKKIKLIDFDCAKNKRQHDLKFQMWTKTGSLNYQAPQYFQSTIYDEKVDLWAAGVIAYQLVTGDLPFKSNYYNRYVKLIIEQNIDIDGLKVSEEFKVLLKKLLQKNPALRFSASDCLRLTVILKAKHVRKMEIFDDFEVETTSTTYYSARSVEKSSVRSNQTSTCGWDSPMPLLKYFCFVDQI